ncbi:urea amidolyase associated protein UAAP1 [Acidithiobacillus sulfuriphilus]|uniref:Urea carboxylase-associated family protein n=2 Tax=Acidithiobacillus sulfuriphilus TaxID=1867749 RepID=A0A3M8RWN1_9PROT|nr:urea amidolyase associated protein UAAP1 [Acidithiobacillus sulfuriphilus]RNF71430.1 urea carboxylase-associated family protein [Acidithiobacillus sulfuriphilus]
MIESNIAEFEDQNTWTDEIPGGAHTSFVMRRNTILRVIDLEGAANVVALFYNHDDKLERYNMADTLKAQHTAYLTKGLVCYSDMGRILCSITEDSCGWHDTICGMTDARQVHQKYGDKTYHNAHNNMHRNARDSVIVELCKWGMGKIDIVPNVNFFSKVFVDNGGDLHFKQNNSKAGDFVDLRFEMNTLVILATCQHPLDPNPNYAPKPIRITARRTSSAGRYDFCRMSCPENKRGFYNTEILFG